MNSATGVFAADKIDTYDFGRGDGHATVNLASYNGALVLGAGISASDVLYEADAAGDLTVSIRGDADDSITMTNDLTAQAWDTYSQVLTISTTDGGVQTLGEPYFYQGAPLTFT